MPLIEIEGDLLNAGEPVIVQQLNCLCVRGHGLSASIAKKFPYADVYGARRALGKRNLAIPEDQGIPGTISVSYPDTSRTDNSVNGHNPIVIGLYGQYDYGKPAVTGGKKYNKRTSLAQDNYELRTQWFAEALENLQIWLIDHQISAIAFPYGIGCGLAGGDWQIYSKLLNKFSEQVPCKVLIYKLNKLMFE